VRHRDGDEQGGEHQRSDQGDRGELGLARASEHGEVGDPPAAEDEGGAQPESEYHGTLSRCVPPDGGLGDAVREAAGEGLGLAAGVGVDVGVAVDVGVGAAVEVAGCIGVEVARAVGAGAAVWVGGGLGVGVGLVVGSTV
jgi:hypothetical protein